MIRFWGLLLVVAADVTDGSPGITAGKFLHSQLYRLDIQYFAPLLGWLGVFLTGSDTSSNALFCGMQRSTAQAVGMPPELAVAVNSSGGVTGKMISPQSISVATAATGMIGQEGNLFRFALGHSIAMTLFICILTYLQATVWQWMLP